MARAGVRPEFPYVAAEMADKSLLSMPLDGVGTLVFDFIH
jgi:hypothetical protein